MGNLKQLVDPSILWEQGDPVTNMALDALGMQDVKKYGQSAYMFGGMDDDPSKDPGGLGAWGEEKEEEAETVYPKRTWVRPPNYDANQDDLRPLAFQDGGMPRQAQELAAMPRQAQELAAMPRQAQELAARGRRGDTTLAHVNPLELEGIARLFPDQAITRNPDTGLPEMFISGKRCR